LRVIHHPILGEAAPGVEVEVTVDGKPIQAFEGEPLAAAMIAAGIQMFRYTAKTHLPRGIFCAIGRCTDCMMIVDGIPNTRTCVTPVKAGMVVQTQDGLGKFEA
jgi:predicted molibdopterin-dependent oxidoreductase YjgC